MNSVLKIINDLPVDEVTKKELVNLSLSNRPGLLDAVQNLVGEKPGFSPVKKMSFKKMAQELKAWSNQLSDSNFKGKLSSIITEYKKGVNEITKKVAEQLGDISTVDLARTYSETLDIMKPFMEYGTKVKDIGTIENTLTNLYKISKNSGARIKTDTINDFIIKNFGTDFVSTMDRSGAKKEISDFILSGGKDNTIKKIMQLTRDPYGPTNSITVSSLSNGIDTLLPKREGLSHLIRSTSAATSIYADTQQLFRGRLIGNTISSALGVGSFVAGGPFTGTAGIATGLALQRPEVLKRLIQGAAKVGGKKFIAPTIKQPVRGGSQILTQLMKL